MPFILFVAHAGPALVLPDPQLCMPPLTKLRALAQLGRTVWRTLLPLSGLKWIGCTQQAQKACSLPVLCLGCTVGCMCITVDQKLCKKLRAHN